MPGMAISVPARQRRPDAGVEVAERADGRPPGSADVAGMQRRGDQPAGRASRACSTRAIAAFCIPYSPNGGDSVVLGHRDLQARPVLPDRAAVQQVPGVAAQSLHQRHGRRQGEARPCRSRRRTSSATTRLPNDPVGLRGFTVDENLLDLAPGLVDDVRLALAAAEIDDLVPGPDQPGNEEAADMPAAADHHDAHGCRA